MKKSTGIKAYWPAAIGGLAWAAILATGLSLSAGEVGPPIRDPRYTFESAVWSIKALREQNVVMQKHDYTCGAATLATVIRYYWGDKVDEEMFIKAIVRDMTLEQIKDRMENGLSMTDLRRGAVATGYLAMMGERSYAQMTELKVPVIIRIKHRDHEHFVVFRGMVGDRVFLADPIRGNVRQSFESFQREWTDGVVLAIAKPNITELPKNAPLMVQQHSPVQPELQAARRQLVLQR